MAVALGSLPDWNTQLLVHARMNDLPAVVALSRTERVGGVITTGQDRRTAMGIVRRWSDEGASGPLMLDADRYSGQKRKLARHGVSSGWLREQLTLGLPWALTDSGYIGEGDLEGLRIILTAARAAGGRVIAALPLAPHWFAAGLNVLISEIVAAGVPVALILEHREDPFGVRKTVQGIARLLDQADVPVLTLRTDVSGVGTLAFGATAAAIGTSSGLRHLFPLVDKPGGRPGAKSVSLLHMATLSYRTVAKLIDAVTADPDHPSWFCPCSACFGRRVDWILYGRNPHTAAFAHSVSALRALTDDVTAAHLSVEERRLSWVEMCGHAQALSYDIQQTGGDAWHPKPFLAAWNTALPVRV